MQRPLLNDRNQYPTDTMLASALERSIDVYQTFKDSLYKNQIELEWHYYNDGKSWLGKAVSKKKTVFWLSVWQGFFKVSFHFSEKARLGVMNLPISLETKVDLENAPIKGKLVSMAIDVTDQRHLEDLVTLISYKQSLK